MTIAFVDLWANHIKHNHNTRFTVRSIRDFLVVRFLNILHEKPLDKFCQEIRAQKTRILTSLVQLARRRQRKRTCSTGRCLLKRGHPSSSSGPSAALSSARMSVCSVLRAACPLASPYQTTAHRIYIGPSPRLREPAKPLAITYCPQVREMGA